MASAYPHKKDEIDKSESELLLAGPSSLSLSRLHSNSTESSEPSQRPPQSPGASGRGAMGGGGLWGLSPAWTTAFIVGSWYFSNIGVLLLNKYLLSFYGFRYPVFLTLLHMVACALFSYVSIRHFEVVPLQFIASSRQLIKIVVLSSIFCLSVVLGNMSLRFIPVSFNQAIGATTPAFTALIAFLVTLKAEGFVTYLTLIPVILGIVIASNSEPSWHLWGVIFCFSSTAGRGLKSVLQGLLLSNESEKLHSMNLLLYMAPIAICFLLPAAFVLEGNVAAVVIEKARSDPWILGLLFLNATAAYLTNLTNFLVTKHTSALTLQVLGNAKGAVAAVVSVLIFKNPVTAMGAFGFAITIGGVVLYGEAKKRSK